MSAAHAGEGVAITGMACLFPGAANVQEYWANILGGVDAISDPPPEAWDPELYYDPEFSDVDRTYVKRGGYLGSLASFAPLAHGIPPVAVGGEPDQWLALQVATDALADAGASDLGPEIRRRTAIVLGKGTYLNGGNAVAVQRGLVVGQTVDLIRGLHPEYTEQELAHLRSELQGVLPPLSSDTVAGLIPNIIVGRIANRLDLMGPSYTIDAACASSLVAVQHAVRDLQAGDCDLALAGGSQVWMPVATMNLFCRLGALSRRQQLRAFDKDADGTLLGEGIGMVVLKRLADATRDGDRVYAVIRGVGVASDGRGASVMAPRIEGEQLALQRAYEAAGVSPSTIGLVEAHGTGTEVGDVTEVHALTSVFGERDGGLPHCALGSVKTMISHTIPAAGVASLIKVALSLHHRVLPPTLHCDEPNPGLGLDRSPFYINTETRPWIHGGAEPRRAGINAFGFGGINAHAVVEEFSGTDAATPAHAPVWPAEVCVLEAADRQALSERATELAAALASEPDLTLADLAFTLAGERGAIAQPTRLAIVADSLPDVQAKLRLAAEKLAAPSCRRIRAASGIYYESEPLGSDGKVVLVFPGEGSQYPNMLADLCLQFPEARAVFDRIDRLYADHPRRSVLSDWVYPRPAFSEEERRSNADRLMDLDVAVESVLTANAAVYEVVSRLLGRVDAMVGHSTGEHSAAMVGGALALDSDERLAEFCLGLNYAYAEAAARDNVPDAVLLALGTDAQDARRIADLAVGELYVAMDNCPHQVVLSGERAAATRARGIAANEGIVCEVLPYDRAVHTPLFAPYAEQLRAVFARMPVRATTDVMWSCTTAAPYPHDVAEVHELLVDHWTSPVRFRETIEALHDEGARVFVEVGPRGNLTAFIQDILRGRPSVAIAADVQRRSAVVQLLHLAGMLAAHDVPVDLGYLFARRSARTVDYLAPPAPPAPAPERVALNTTWPMLRLPAETLAQLRPAAAPTAAPTPPAAPPPAVAPAPTAAATPPAAPPPAVVLPPPLAPDDELAAVVNGHLRTMEHFIQASADVVQAYLGVQPPTAPLLGTVVEAEPGQWLVARRLVDPQQDRYLLHHTLGRSVSRADPELTALPIMPLAMSMELLAEAAWSLRPELIVTGMRDVRAHRWLAFSEPGEIELRARVADPSAVAPAVRVELHDTRDGTDRPVVEAWVLLSADYDTPADVTEVALSDARPSRFAPAELYREAMFHQPLWQGVQAVRAVGANGAHATLRTLPRTGLLRDDPDPWFALDPVTLDAAGQLIGFWTADQLQSGRVVFPFRLAGLDLHSPPLPPGELLNCMAEIRLHSDQLVSSDIAVTDADGRAHMRLTGWDDKRFEVPDRFRPLTHPGELTPISTPWPLRGAAQLTCRRVDSRLGPDGELWKQVWASRVLGRRERAVLAGLRMPEGRRLEWLAARTAAKEAVAERLRDERLADLLPADIEILPDERGRPQISLVGEPDLGVVPIVSLAHAGGLAAAVCALVGPGQQAGTGIDLEPLRALPDGFAEAALAPGERRLLGAVDAGDGDEWLLRCWCAKEAAGKAVGSGIDRGPDAPTLTAIDGPSRQVTVAAAGEQLQVHTERDGDLIVATTTYGEAAIVP